MKLKWLERCQLRNVLIQSSSRPRAGGGGCFVYQKVWGLFIDDNFLLNSEIHFLQKSAWTIFHKSPSKWGTIKFQNRDPTRTLYFDQYIILETFYALPVSAASFLWWGTILEEFCIPGFHAFTGPFKLMNKSANVEVFSGLGTTSEVCVCLCVCVDI